MLKIFVISEPIGKETHQNLNMEICTCIHTLVIWCESAHGVV